MSNAPQNWKWADKFVPKHLFHYKDVAERMGVCVHTARMFIAKLDLPGRYVKRMVPYYSLPGTRPWQVRVFTASELEHILLEYLKTKTETYAKDANPYIKRAREREREKKRKRQQQISAGVDNET